MSTVATAVMTRFAKDWAKLYPSAKISGIVGDLRHFRRGGYHIARADNPAGNYSVVRPDDKFGPSDAASAVDMTLSMSDMVLCTRRLITAYANVSDPRRKYMNGFNGWEGVGDAHRWDVYAQRAGYASPDHQWHVHLEFRRKYCNSPTAMAAVLSILSGESVAAYLKKIGVAPAAVSFAPSKLAAPPYPGRVLERKPGRDPAVARWQAQMIARGWKSLGTADGIFGEKTEAVVRRYQRLCKVAVDGVIGRATWPLPWTRPIGS